MSRIAQVLAVLTLCCVTKSATSGKRNGNVTLHGAGPFVKLNRPAHVVYTMSSTEEGKLLAILQPYVTMLEAVLEQYFKSDDEAAVLFKLLGTLGRHVIVKNEVAEVRPALVKESVSFMREYNKFARWLNDNYNDASLLPVADIMNRVFASRFGRRMKIIETEMKRLGKQDAWDDLMKFWNAVNASETEKLFAMSSDELKSLDKFLDKTKSIALEHKSFELLYQTQVVEALADLARSMTARTHHQHHHHSASPTTKYRRTPQLAAFAHDSTPEEIFSTRAGPRLYTSSFLDETTAQLSACTCKHAEDREAKDTEESETIFTSATPKPKKKRHDITNKPGKKDQSSKKKRSENSSEETKKSSKASEKEDKKEKNSKKKSSKNKD